ncbi:PD-(D/E)XK nuclease family protein [Cyanobacterium sp. uoEpiScrs1]|uniref:PD-(D/E)XK nuclease family protein n=1 Tax=Cyanobacterium sp. uoEpiScrs1 TaxID=2976343 RepID=UPI00226AA1F0|nr:PD-(D/E)XK nuclease family protein [Cyanobacterium sp. uoEpiScrs1]
MNNISLIHLSQSHLNLLDTCPPQFQRVYLEQLGTPLSPEKQEKLSWGNQFHQLMQQYELGLSVDLLVAKDKQMQNSLNALINAVPSLRNPSQNSWKEAEHSRTLKFKGYLLTVIYDLLIAKPEKAEILDWKTYLKPENPQKLANNWQTRLYLYILVETSDYLPEQISITYWFVKLPSQPQSLTFFYDKDKHKQNHEDLKVLLNKFENWLNEYIQENINFPHSINCQINCPYSQLLGPEQSTSITLNKAEKNWLSIIEEIQEVSLP